MNAVYPTFRPRLVAGFIAGELVSPAALRVVLVDESYVYDPAHTDLGDIVEDSIIAGPIDIENVTLDGTTLAGDDMDFVAEVGRVARAVVLFFESDTSTFLFAYIDSTDDSSLPQNIITGEVRIRWNEDGICRI